MKTPIELTAIAGHILMAKRKLAVLEGLLDNGLGYSPSNLLKQFTIQAKVLANHAITIRTLAEQQIEDKG